MSPWLKLVFVFSWYLVPSVHSSNIFQSADTPPVFERSRLDPPEGEDGYGFGEAIMFSETTLVVGAPYRHVDGIEEAGSVFVYVRNNDDEWVLQDILIEPTDNADAENYFGLSIAILDDTIVVGSPGMAKGTGGAYVFSRPAGGSEWSLLQNLNVGGAPGDAFGTTLNLGTSALAVGALYGNGGRGEVYVYSHDPGNAETPIDTGSVQTLTPTLSSTSDGGFFGFALGVHDGFVFVGAPGDSTGGEFAGALYSFAHDRGTGTYSQQDKITGRANHALGTSMTSVGDQLAVAAPLIGSVFSYSLETGALVLQQVIDVHVPGNQSGFPDMATDQETLVFGSFSEVDDGMNGVALVSQLNGTTWVGAIELRPSEDLVDGFFGFPVALSSDTIAVGSLVGRNSSAGAVYLFDTPPRTASVSPTSPLSESPSAAPSERFSPEPSKEPSQEPSPEPTLSPEPSKEPSQQPSPGPTIPPTITLTPFRNLLCRLLGLFCN